MDKQKLNRFISKYFLNGAAESVIWHSNGNLSVKFIDESKTLVGEVVQEKTTFPESTFGVNQTSKLRSLLGVLADSIDVEIKKKNDIAIQMNISDSNVDVNYILADTTIIPKVPNLKALPTWNLTLTADEKFIDNFVKACNALNDVKEFAVIAKNDKVNFVVGHSNINTTKVAVNVDVKTYNDMPTTYFPTNLFREILVANKDCKTGKIEIAPGLMRASFNVDDFKATYYLAPRGDSNN